MKTKIKLLFMLAMVLAGYMGKTQCTTSFQAVLGNGGDVNIWHYDSAALVQSTFWDFGDGTTDTAEHLYNFTHNYAAGGTYIICLTTTTNTGCVANFCDTVVVDRCAGAAAFNSDITNFGEYTFTANPQGVYPSATYAWDFGDGTTSTLASPVHQYATDGNYAICLTVTDATLGCSNHLCNGANVVKCQFASNFSYDSIINSSNGFFAVTNPAPGADYLWHFGDGNGGAGDTITHRYATPGYYLVNLVTESATNGCADSASRYIYYDPCGLGPVNVSVNSNGLDASFYVNGPYNISGITYLWDFPDASPSSSTIQGPATTYSQLGANVATLYISTGTCVDTFTSSLTLTPPVYNVSGTIYKNGAQGCANIYLIRQDSPNHVVLVDSLVTIDSLGQGCYSNYIFYSLAPGTYYIKGALTVNDPAYASYLPTYYGDELHWADATPVVLSTSSLNGIDVNLVAGSNPGGPGFIGGDVTLGAGLVANTDNHSGRSVGQPIAFVQVDLLTIGDAPVAYTFTDAAGHYQFSNLALGSYKIFVEQLNKTADKVPVTLTQQNPIQSQTDFSVNSTGATATGINDLNTIEINQLYPNPVITETQVELTSKIAADATLKLIDVLGRTEMERNIKLTAGDNKMTVNMETFAAGVYQLVVQTDNKRISYKVVKAK